MNSRSHCLAGPSTVLSRNLGLPDLSCLRAAMRPRGRRHRPRARRRCCTYPARRQGLEVRRPRPATAGRGVRLRAIVPSPPIVGGECLPACGGARDHKKIAHGGRGRWRLALAERGGLAAQVLTRIRTFAHLLKKFVNRWADSDRLCRSKSLSCCLCWQLPFIPCNLLLLMSAVNSL